MAKAPYNTAAWRKVREFVLDRDGRICRYCGAPANTADHVIGVSKLHPRDPALLDPANLVAACGPCNSSKKDRPGPRRLNPPGGRRRPPRRHPAATRQRHHRAGQPTHRQAQAKRANQRGRTERSPGRRGALPAQPPARQAPPPRNPTSRDW